MDPFFTEEQLNNMSRENMMEVMRIMQNQVRKKETEVQLLKDKQKELEFMNAMLSDRLALAQRRRFGSSSEKYADGYEQMDLFNEAEANADTDAAEIEEEIVIPSHKRKKRTGKKEEDLSNFEVTETIEYKLTGEDRYCPDCGTKYKVVTKEVVKRLKFIPYTFEVEEEVTYVYSCPKCGAMIRPEREFPLIKLFFGFDFSCYLIVIVFQNRIILTRFCILLMWFLNYCTQIVPRTFPSHFR